MFLSFTFHFHIFSAEAYISIKRLQEFLLKEENKLCAITSDNVPNKAKMNGEHENGHAINGTTKAAIQFVSLENEANKEHNVTIPIADNGTKTTKPIKVQRIVNMNYGEKRIQFENATAAWSLNEKNKRGVFDINAVIKPGLCTIVGQVGSGKSVNKYKIFFLKFNFINNFIYLFIFLDLIKCYFGRINVR